MKLYLSKNSEDNLELQKRMTDSMWAKVEVDYADSIHLLLEDQSKILEIDIILEYLKDDLSLQEKFKNASESFKKILANQLSGKRILADNPEIEKRRAICKDCPFNTRTFYGKTCSRCGCNIKAKTSFLTEACPEGKW